MDLENKKEVLVDWTTNLDEEALNDVINMYFDEDSGVLDKSTSFKRSCLLSLINDIDEYSTDQMLNEIVRN